MTIYRQPVYLLFLCSCSEYDIKQLCVDTNNAFDVEEVSVLQDAAAYPGARDAIVMDFDSGDFDAGEGWRVVTVQALAMIPSWEFDEYDDSSILSIEIYDANNPNSVTPWVVQQTIRRSDWEWREVRLPDDAATAGQTFDFDQMRAWVSFDFATTIPQSGMNSAQYIISVSWPQDSGLAVGYSNFNLACDKNWTDWGSGFSLNSTTANAFECSWPMFRLELETRKYQDDCGE